MRARVHHRCPEAERATHAIMSSERAAHKHDEGPPKERGFGMEWPFLVFAEISFSFRPLRSAFEASYRPTGASGLLRMKFRI